MNIALLCPGPSLADFPGVSGFDRTIGVNRAALAHPCDVWACGDYPLIERVRHQVIGKPELFTAAVSAAHLRDHSTHWPGDVVEFEWLYGVCPAEWRWDHFTATASLVYAAWRGVKRIDVYGCDWAGTGDWDDTQAGGNRNDARWDLERGIWQNVLTPWLNKQGITINRHGHT